MGNYIFQNPYPSVGQISNVDNSQQNNQNSLLNKILPLLISGKNLTEILPSILGNNQLINSILSSLSNKQTEKQKRSTTKTSKIDMKGYVKID